MALPWSNYPLGPKLKMAPGRAVPTLPTVCVYETVLPYGRLVPHSDIRAFFCKIKKYIIFSFFSISTIYLSPDAVISSCVCYIVRYWLMISVTG